MTLCKRCKSSRNCLNGLYCEDKGKYVEYAAVDCCDKFKDIYEEKI